MTWVTVILWTRLCSDDYTFQLTKPEPQKPLTFSSIPIITVTKTLTDMTTHSLQDKHHITNWLRWILLQPSIPYQYCYNEEKLNGNFRIDFSSFVLNLKYHVKTVKCEITKEENNAFRSITGGLDFFAPRPSLSSSPSPSWVRSLILYVNLYILSTIGF